MKSVRRNFGGKKRISLRLAVVLANVLIIFFVSMFGAGVLAVVWSKYADNINNEKKDTHLRWLNENINRNFTTMENVAFSVVLDEDVQAVAERNLKGRELSVPEEREEIQDLRKKFANAIETFSLRIDSVTLFILDTREVKVVNEAGPIMYYDTELREELWYQDFLESGELWYCAPSEPSDKGYAYYGHDVNGKRKEGRDEDVISLYCRLQNSSATENYGVVRVSVRPADFFADAQSVYPDDSLFLYRVTDGDKLIYGNVEGFNGKKYSVYSYSRYDMEIEYALGDGESGVNTYLVVPLLLIILSGLVISAFTLVFFNEFFKKIMNDVRNYSPSDGTISSGFSEINEYGQRLGSLVKKVDELSKERYSLEKKQQQAKLLSLQYQINPHFLFNMLEVFRARADISGDGEASDAISDFADIMRYNISDSSAVSTIRQEIDVLVKFIELFRFRYKDTLFFKVDCAEEFLDVPMMKFVLQPIAENAIKYGKKGKRVMTIRVSVEREGAFLKICVENDGEPIPKERLEEVRKYIARTEDNEEDANFIGGDEYHDSTGIGLKNVAERLRLFYGGRGSLEVDSAVEDRITRITLYLPE